MNLRDEYVLALERENEVLLERIAGLEEKLGLRVEVPFALGLSGQEARLFGMLLKRDLVTKDAGMVALYAHKSSGEEADQKIVDVFICKMRKKLAPFSIIVETHWGQGWFLGQRSKEIARAMLPSERAVA